MRKKRSLVELERGWPGAAEGVGWWCCFHENSLLKYNMIQESAQIIDTGLSKLSKVNTPE